MRQVSPLRLISIKAPILCHYHRSDKYVYDCKGDNKHSSDCLYPFWPLIVALEILHLGFCFKFFVEIFLFVCLNKVFWLCEFFRGSQITEHCRSEFIWGSNFFSVWEFTKTEVITFSRNTPTLVKDGKLSHKCWTCRSSLWTRCSLILRPAGPPLIV